MSSRADSGDGEGSSGSPRPSPPLPDSRDAARRPPGLRRREFLVGGAAAAGALFLGAAGGAPRDSATAPSPAPSVLVRAQLKGGPPSGGPANQRQLEALLAAALTRLTGHADPSAALRELVPPGKRVGVKVNCLAGRGLSTRPELVNALVELLAQAGVRREEVLVWDRSDRELEAAGFTVRRKGSGYRCRGTEQAYEAELFESGAVAGCFSRLLTRSSEVVINLPVLKDHDLSGISGALKNFYGAIHNPNKYHGGGCSPFIAQLYAHPMIRGRVTLTICDALRPQCDGGPAFRPSATWGQGELLLSRDPVAIDALGATLVDAERARRGLLSLEQSGRAPRWLAIAQDLGLGRLGPEGVQVRWVP